MCFNFLFVANEIPVPTVLNRYVDEIAGEGLAEVYEARTTFHGQPFLIHVLATSENGILPAGGKFSVQVTPLTPTAARIFKEARLVIIEPLDAANYAADEPMPVSFRLEFDFHEEVLFDEGLLHVGF